MNFLIFLIMGGIAGWLASLVMRKGADQGVILNVIVGVAGSVLGGWILPLVGLVPSGRLGAFVTALIGAIVLLAIVNLIRRGRIR
ncbi:MAG: GlsB/YeaQ/YmgE family stress response membrane protein [Xanthomonadaceae bacterium]|jgi:uncharacterized membrane protein YeaQ/YmgE (transglycosylase-associated protein family)|nr:GlsB/YeaQ/YmgE family stress response membrane protein [Xanthomonadaceae bacterium]